MEFKFDDLEPVLATLSKLFVNDGYTKQVAILAEATAKLQSIDWDNHGQIELYKFYLSIPDYLFSQILDEREKLENEILEKTSYILAPYFDKWYIKGVSISPMLSNDTQWREKANAFINGEGINNQGRVRSDNIASKSCDGLLFRSQPEIYLYQALKALGVTFAPLPVFLRGGQDYRRIEPDFLIIKDGIVMIVEVDGDTYHQELPAQAHNRLNMLSHEGAILERIFAKECETPEKAKECASKLIEVLGKHKQSMR